MERRTSTRSPGSEPEVVRTLWLVGGLVYLGMAVLRVFASLEIPAAKSLQFLHVDPDASHGDIYFDATPR